MIRFLAIFGLFVAALLGAGPAQASAGHAHHQAAGAPHHTAEYKAAPLPAAALTVHAHHQHSQPHQQDSSADCDGACSSCCTAACGPGALQCVLSATFPLRAVSRAGGLLAGIGHGRSLSPPLHPPRPLA